MGSLLDDCTAVTAANVEPVWISGDFLTSNGLEGGSDFPIWHGAGELEFSSERATQAGLQSRPVRETARDLLTWWDTLPEERTAKLRAGLSVEKEAEVIAAWKAKT